MYFNLPSAGYELLSIIEYYWALGINSIDTTMISSLWSSKTGKISSSYDYFSVFWVCSNLPSARYKLSSIIEGYRASGIDGIDATMILSPWSSKRGKISSSYDYFSIFWVYSHLLSARYKPSSIIKGYWALGINSIDATMILSL